MNRDDPGGHGINRSTAGLSGTGALTSYITVLNLNLKKSKRSVDNMASLDMGY